MLIIGIIYYSFMKVLLQAHWGEKRHFVFDLVYPTCGLVFLNLRRTVRHLIVLVRRFD